MFQQLTQQATHAAPILAPEDGPSFEVTNDLGISRVILVCEHASNRVPASLGSLGLTDDKSHCVGPWSIRSIPRLEPRS